jgi:hypothetical protein
VSGYPLPSTSAESILRGDLRGVKTPSPLTDSPTRRVIADQARADSGFTEACPDPRDICAMLDLGLLDYYTDLHPEECLAMADAVSDGRIVRWIHHPDARVNGLRVFCGLSGALLCRSRSDFNATDVWLLAGELVLPTWLRSSIRHLDHATRLQRHAPASILAAILHIQPLQLQRQST